MKNIIKEIKPIVYAIGVAFTLYFFMNSIHASTKDFNELKWIVSYDQEYSQRNNLDTRLYDLNEKYGDNCEGCSPELKKQYHKWKRQLEDTERRILELEKNKK